jgi:DNA-binding Lrp family transcriptional regulator
MPKKIPIKTSQLDEKNREIINILAQNGRERLVSIAKKIGMSVDATRSRIAQLEKDGIIKKFTIELDIEKVGMPFESQVYIKLNNISRQRLNELVEHLKADARITTVLGVLGSFDIFIVITGRNTDELTSVRNKVREAFKDIIADWNEVLVTQFYKLEEYKMLP